MTGLPEKEALGLNVLEAQACGCPVLADRCAAVHRDRCAPEVTGLLYRDPRADGGAAFERFACTSQLQRRFASTKRALLLTWRNSQAKRFARESQR
jgi:glycosyltransferase involved in cell wall biosynthesis